MMGVHCSATLEPHRSTDGATSAPLDLDPESRQIKEVLRQRCFFVRQRTMLRNRIHRLLGAQHEVKLPQCSDLFSSKGLSFLEKLELPAPARLLLAQQLALFVEADEAYIVRHANLRFSQGMHQLSCGEVIGTNDAADSTGEFVPSFSPSIMA